jgi:hypothetical protein
MRILLPNKAVSNSSFPFVYIRDVALCCLRDAAAKPEASGESAGEGANIWRRGFQNPAIVGAGRL